MIIALIKPINLCSFRGNVLNQKQFESNSCTMKQIVTN
ncbi:hypothetical protein RG47T_4489 [Mucilaginibacter polytrichastri]|uniref:Uncharacterized protein n=1 Tax=Mucilaginibacter polytrichastri TaxID=1302689 RepID=A0A1Q6A4S9_9SPHI|nr:hypothetical protein RG47T_4489 [Mucilaginibacter polytrichastri]